MLFFLVFLPQKYFMFFDFYSHSFLSSFSFSSVVLFFKFVAFLLFLAVVLFLFVVLPRIKKTKIARRMFTPFFLYLFVFCCEKQYKTLSLRNSLAFWKHCKQSKTKWKMLKQKDCDTGNQKVLSKSVSCWVPQKVVEGQKELRLRLLWCVSKSVLHTLLSQESPHIDFVVFCILHAPYFWGPTLNTTLPLIYES